MTDDHTRRQAFLLSGFSRTPTRGEVTILMFDQRARVRRALLGLGQWWGIALVCVLIPVAHFVLVPSFFFYGIWRGVQRGRTAECPLPVRGVCPDCGAEQPLDLATRWYAPQQVVCRRCGRGLTLTSPPPPLPGS